MKRIIIDIGHPAHVHLYRNLIKSLQDKGNQVIVTVKNLDSAKQLLRIYNIPFHELSKKSDSLSGKLLKQIQFDFQVLGLIRKFKIDIGLGTSITNAHVSRISRMDSIIFDDDDDDVQPLFVKYAHPFAHCVVSPDVLKGRRKKCDTVYYAGYHELAYLHPNWFTPDLSVLKDAGVHENEPFFIMRFNAFKAHHDVGVRGLDPDQKMRLVDILSGKGKVFITTERDIEPGLKPYQLKVSPEKAHTLLYYATMFVGDSQTMTSEAAVLGTPAIRCNSLVGRISYLEEEEHKYGLTYGFKPENFSSLLEKLNELISMPHLKEEWQRRRQKMLADKIDVTAFMVWFIENYPESARTMKENPDYQYNFK